LQSRRSTREKREKKTAAVAAPDTSKIAVGVGALLGGGVFHDSLIMTAIYYITRGTTPVALRRTWIIDNYMAEVASPSAVGIAAAAECPNKSVYYLPLRNGAAASTFINPNLIELEKELLQIDFPFIFPRAHCS